MMTLDPEVLLAAQTARERVLERQHELERARVDLHHEIRRLHAAGGSMREISERLGISHQRVHQIVIDGDQQSDPLVRRLGGRLQRTLRGALAHFTDEARAVLAQSDREAGELGASAIGTEHLLLALSASEDSASAPVLTTAGVTHDRLRAAVAKQAGAQARPGDRRRRRLLFDGPSKKAIELSLREALANGDDHIGSDHLLLGLLRGADHRTLALLHELDVTPQAIRDALAAA
jgi:hypothetical protein